MGRLAKTGIAILGLAALGGFVSLLGGPNVFSTFSNAISTIFPESEVAITKTEETKNQDEVPTNPEPEAKEELGVKEPVKEVEEKIVTSATETTQTVSALISERRPIEQPQSKSPVIPPPVSDPTPSSVPRGPANRKSASESGGDRYSAPSPVGGSGSKGSGIFCVTVGKDPWMMEKGQTCGTWIYN